MPLAAFFIPSFRPTRRAVFSQAGEVNDITTYDHKNKWHQMVCVCSLMYIWGNLLPPGGETVAL